MKKKLTSLLENVSDYSYKGGEVDVTGITDDSRKVSEGNLFVAIKGLTVDGHNYIDRAIENGARAIVGEIEPKKEWLSSVTYVKVSNSSDVLGRLAASWYDNPAKSLKLIGVTGTDGKTTTANILYHLLTTAGIKVGLISTISAKIGAKDYDTGFHVTNPSALALHKYLRDMLDAGCTHAVLEVTSHGLVQGRVAGLNFDYSILTNITNEHLDYHKTYDAYIEAKSRLFKASKVSVLNKDDRSVTAIVPLIEDDTTIKFYSRESEADIYATDISVADKTSFTYHLGNTTSEVASNLVGEFNVSNSLAAIFVGQELGVNEEEIRKAFKSITTPTGRLQRIENSLGINIIIDYAHTPNGVESVMKEFTRDFHGRVISIVSAEGERDPGKRFEIPKISAQFSTLTIVNPIDIRSETYDSISAEMIRGAKAGGAKLLEGDKLNEAGSYFMSYEDRGQAIYDAIHVYAQKGDTVLILGKGHETGMDFGDIEHPYSDLDEVQTALSVTADRAAIILAGGVGSRMNHAVPKVLRKIAHRSLIYYTIENLRRAKVGEIILTVGYAADEVKRSVGTSIKFAMQDKPLGTGHAAQCGLTRISKSIKQVYVLHADDTAFYRKETIEDLYQKHLREKATISFIAYTVDDPTGLGRIILDGKGNLQKIVEEKDATEDEKKITLVNNGMYIFDREWLSNNITKLETKNKQGEYYLTDTIQMALLQGKRVSVYKLDDSSQSVGINTPEQLDYADQKMRERIQKM